MCELAEPEVREAAADLAALLAVGLSKLLCPACVAAGAAAERELPAAPTAWGAMGGFNAALAADVPPLAPFAAYLVLSGPLAPAVAGRAGWPPCSEVYFACWCCWFIALSGLAPPLLPLLPVLLAADVAVAAFVGGEAGASLLPLLRNCETSGDVEAIDTPA